VVAVMGYPVMVVLGGNVMVPVVVMPMGGESGGREQSYRSEHDNCRCPHGVMPRAVGGKRGG